MSTRIGNHKIGPDAPVFFIADIAANHDGSLKRAKKLIRLAAESGADSAKFQHFTAEMIVSDFGFRTLKGVVTHQSSWKKPVTEVYRKASVPWEWTPELKDECDRYGLEFSSTPYDLQVADMLNAYVSYFKIGSGDIDWPELQIHVAEKKKPVLLGTGASTMEEVRAAYRRISSINPNCVIMQCNTNYTADPRNVEFANLKVLDQYRMEFEGAMIGLSDHNIENCIVLGAIALGACVVERHFTDDNSRHGPDHKFAMNPNKWAKMVKESRRLEVALGSPNKEVCENELSSRIVQRRCVRAAKQIEKGVKIRKSDVINLRPAPEGSIPPSEIAGVIGKRARKRIPPGKSIETTDIE